MVIGEMRIYMVFDCQSETINEIISENVPRRYKSKMPQSHPFSDCGKVFKCYAKRDLMSY